MTTNITVGSRVRVHDRELPHLSDSEYRGKEGVVTDTYGQRGFRVEFDDPTLDSSGSWTTMGIELVPEDSDAPFKVGDRVRIRERHRHAAPSWARELEFAVTSIEKREGYGDGYMVSVESCPREGVLNSYGANWFELAKKPGDGYRESMAAENAQLREMNQRLDAARITAEKLTLDWMQRFDLMDEELDEQIEKTRAAEKARDSYAASLTYALELLEDPVKVQRVLGYQDGVS